MTDNTINIERFENQTGIIAPDKLAGSFLIIGAGAIGSFVATTIAKMGATDISVLDFDTIEEHNIANQMFPEYMVGKEKTEALADVVKQYSGIEILKIKTKWTPDSNLVGNFSTIIVAVDNMDVRKQIWDYYKTHETTKLFIDGRMGAQVLRAYAIDPKNKEQVELYEKSLYPASKAVPERCTAKSIIYTVLLVSGILLNLVKKALNNERRPTEVVYDCVTDTQVATYK